MIMKLLCEEGAKQRHLSPIKWQFMKLEVSGWRSRVHHRASTEIISHDQVSVIVSLEFWKLVVSFFLAGFYLYFITRVYWCIVSPDILRSSSSTSVFLPLSWESGCTLSLHFKHNDYSCPWFYFFSKLESTSSPSDLAMPFANNIKERLETTYWNILSQVQVSALRMV